MRVYTELESS